MTATGVVQPGQDTHPWLAYYPPAVPHQLDEAKIGTLADLIRRSCATYADRPAFESFGKTISFAETLRAAEAFAGWLQAQGLQKGDRVALMMPNILAYPAAIFGTLIGGFTVVNVNPLYTARELIHQINDAGARILVVIENFAHVVEEAKAKLKLDVIVIATAGDLMGFKGTIVNFVARRIKKVVKPFDLPGAVRLNHILQGAAGMKPVTIAPEDVAFLQYTGGTTGVAKGATLTHRNVAANVQQAGLWLEWVLEPPQGRGEYQHVMVTALPLYHIFALTCCCMFLLRIGAKSLLIANPRDIPGFVKTLKASRFTLISGVNTLYNALANHPEIGTVNFGELRFAVAGGMATQAAVAKQWKAVTGRPIIEGYGLSETSPVATINRPDIQEFSGTIGYPIPSTEIVIRDADGNDVPIGESGEICIRGPQVMRGYWNRPDETAKAMTADGYFRSGDIGVMLPDGQFKIVDRMKDMILVSGFNVYPNEVEDVLAAHPAVLESAVIGLPDEHSGEVVAAFVVRKDETLTADELRAYCKENLTGYKVPKQIFFRESLPKTNVGKVLRRALREEVVTKR
ncbi:AMP-binding protein [Bosea thiooxidans]|nr:AMP-binding protein [Bosea sp. (in: a-proteobacteria)]